MVTEDPSGICCRTAARGHFAELYKRIGHTSRYEGTYIHLQTKILFLFFLIRQIYSGNLCTVWQTNFVVKCRKQQRGNHLLFFLIKCYVWKKVSCEYDRLSSWTSDSGVFSCVYSGLPEGNDNLHAGIIMCGFTCRMFSGLLGDANILQAGIMWL